MTVATIGTYLVAAIGYGTAVLLVAGASFSILVGLLSTFDEDKHRLKQGIWRLLLALVIAAATRAVLS